VSGREPTLIGWSGITRAGCIHPKDVERNRVSNMRIYCLIVALTLILMIVYTRQVIPIGRIEAGQICLVKESSIGNVEPPLFLDYRGHENKSMRSGKSHWSVRKDELIVVDPSARRNDH